PSIACEHAPQGHKAPRRRSYHRGTETQRLDNVSADWRSGMRKVALCIALLSVGGPAVAQLEAKERERILAETALSEQRASNRRETEDIQELSRLETVWNDAHMS